VACVGWVGRLYCRTREPYATVRSRQFILLFLHDLTNCVRAELITRTPGTNSERAARFS
jgi:hypothetical protein